MAVRLIEARTGQPFAAEIQRRREQGMSFRQIGAEFRISGQTVWRNFRRASPPAHAAAAERPLEVELALPVRTYDIDFAGVVSNIVYIRWLEDLRLKLLDEHLPLEEQVKRGCVPVVASTRIEYRRPIRLFDQPIGRMWMSEVGRVRWTLHAEVLLDGRPAAAAVQTGAFVSLVSLRPVAIPAELAARFRRQVGDRK
jgi:acyl-CoA thioester hydrolase